MIKDKVKAFLSTHVISMKIHLMIVMLMIGMLPLLIQSRMLSGSFRQSQVEVRQQDILNQGQILSNKMTRAGYLDGTGDNTQLDHEMDILADIYNGRIVIINQNFRIVRDTFQIAENRTHIAEEVLKCFQGESTSRYNKEKHYFAQTFPVYDATDEKNIVGVISITTSTERILGSVDSIMNHASFYQSIILFILIVVVALTAIVMVRPFQNLQKSLNRVADGETEVDIEENTYRETKNISSAVDRTLNRLKAVDQSRQEFVSNVSHELKTPITSIRVLADSLMSMEDVPVELYREFMNDISDEIDREGKIIDDLLALVKMDKSKAEMNISNVDINGLVKTVLKRIRPIAGKRNVELIFESIRDVTADVDEVKMSLALSNLVENAVKYNITDGWVRVTLDADHKFFYVKVADSGIGIPEEFQNRIFERFYRVDKARSRETGGSGLGLAITRNVVLMHKGAIKVHSKEGEGTVFTVRIPLNYIS